MDELKRLAEEGFTASAVEAAINTIEFSLRENNTGSYPRGLSLLTRVMSRWTYNKDPLEGIKVCGFHVVCAHGYGVPVGTLHHSAFCSFIYSDLP